MNPVSVLVGIPSGGDWKPNFGMSLVNMVLASQGTLRSGGRVERLSLYNVRGSILPRNRSEIVARALEGRFSHILFLDDDMLFPQHTLMRLLDHGKAVIACNCPTKMLPSTSTARAKSEDVHGVPINSAETTGVGKVWRVGTGIMLLETRVFRNLPHPWFPIEWNAKLGDYVGEDWAFCSRLEEAGIPIHVDHTLSLEIGHIGSHTFQHSDIPLKG